MKQIIFLLLLILSFQSFADECTRIFARFIETEKINSTIPVKLIQGMKIELQEEGKSPVAAIYLGSLVSVSGKKDYIGFFEEGNPGVLHYIMPDRLIFENSGEGHYIAKSIKQVGPRCAAYSIFNCVRQLNLTNNLSNKEIEKSLSEEENRSSLLVSILNDYYTDRFDGNLKALTKILTPFKYAAYEVPKDEGFKNAVEKNVRMGWPTLLTFSVPNEMSVVDYNIIGHDAVNLEAIALDKKLWQPKASDQAQFGGHMVLIQGVFESNGKKRLLILDPNFEVPRLWDLDTLNNYVGGNISAYVIYKSKN